MSTIYPAQIDNNISIPPSIDLVTPISASVLNTLRGAILAIEGTLGVRPNGIYGTIASRLTAIENSIGGGGSFIAGGDLSGTNIDQTVIGLQGRPISTTFPINGQHLVWDGASWTPITPMAAPTGPASGDLGGTYPNPSVININGASVPLAGSLTTGNVLQVSGLSALTYAPINLSGGSNYVTGTLPISNLPSLAGDVTGSITSNTVVKLQNNAIASTAPTDGYVLTWVGSHNDWEPIPSKTILGVPNLAALRNTIGVTGSTAVMAGYYAIGDGGGGDFYWDTSSYTGDDGATIIVPTGSTTGRWQRIFDGCTINVLWFGAKGDGSTDDTAAIQAALDWGPGTFGVTVNFPSRTFVLTAPVQNVALYITKPVNMVGTLGTPGGQAPCTTFAINGSLPDGYTAGSGLLFEPNYSASPITTPSGSSMRNFSFISYAGNPPRNCIICHTTVNFYDCSFTAACTLSSIQYDSGDIVYPWGQTFSDNACSCYSRLPVDTYCLCDSPIVQNCTFYESPNYNYNDTTTTESFVQQGFNIPFNLTVADATQLIGSHYFLITLPVLTQRNICGVYIMNAIINSTTINCSSYFNPDGGTTPIGTTIPSGALISCGKAFHPHGADAGIGTFIGLSALLSPISFAEGGQVTNTWIQCYSQASRLGYFIYSSSFQPIFIHPGSEDFANSMMSVPGRGALIVGNTMDVRSLNADIESIGVGTAYLGFERVNVTGDQRTYGAIIPNAQQQAPLSMSIDNGLEEFSFTWNSAFDTIPYHVDSLIMNSSDSSGGAYGITGASHSRGKYLSMFCSPTINTQRHWKWKTPVTLDPGSNVVYINGGSFDAGSFTFAEDGYDIWTLAQSAVAIDIEYQSVVDMVHNECYVNGYTMINEGTYARNIACNVINTTSNTVEVNLIWSFDMFVTNYDYGTPGVIG